MGEILYVVPNVNLKVGNEQHLVGGEKVSPPFSEELRAEIAANVRGVSKTLKIVMKEETRGKESDPQTESEAGQGQDKTDPGEGDPEKEVDWTRMRADFFERYVRENPDIADNDKARAKWEKFAESGKLTSPWPYPAVTEIELPTDSL